MITIILVDDHQIVRQGLRLVLEAQPDLDVIAECGDGLDAVQLTEQLQPDVLVVDVMLPSLNGLEVIRQVAQQESSPLCIVLSMYANEAYVLNALNNGAMGYVLKDSGGAELVQAIRHVWEGRRYLSPPLSDRAIEVYATRAQESDASPYDTLTPREREVLHLAAEGFNNLEIGEKLSISSRTVETHRTNMMRKLGFKNQIDLVRYALRKGILPMDD